MKTYLHMVGITVNTITDNSFVEIATLFTNPLWLQNFFSDLVLSWYCMSFLLREISY